MSDPAAGVPRTWLVTGASRGFGREWTVAALEAGDRVAATARDETTLADLVAEFGDAVLPLRLDVTDRPAVLDAVTRTVDRFGRIDVLVNNAGHGLFGMVEEVTEAEARAQLETNFFGALWVLQAVLPVMRAQGSGHVLQVSSVGAIAPLPDLGLYSASKFALEGLSQSLAAEVARFGIRVTLLQPGSYATGWAASAGRARALPAYAAAHEEASAFWTSLQQAQGDPRTTREVVRGLVDEAEPPLRVLLGEGALAVATEEHERRLASWRAGARLSVS